MKLIFVRVDDDWRPPIWWDMLQSRYPRIHQVLRTHDCALMDAAIYSELKKLPAFYARTEPYQPALHEFDFDFVVRFVSNCSVVPVIYEKG